MNVSALHFAVGSRQPLVLPSLVTGGAWEWRNGHVASAGAPHACKIGALPGANLPRMGQRIVNGATPSVAAAGVFFGMAQRTGALRNFWAHSDGDPDFLHECLDAPCLV